MSGDILVVSPGGVEVASIKLIPGMLLNIHGAQDSPHHEEGPSPKE